MAPFDNNGYNSVFGGQNRAPAQIDYINYNLTQDVHLEWPFLAEDDAFVAPAKLDLVPQAPNLIVYMPDASIASVGQDCLIRNMGSYAVSIVDHDGNAICYIETGLQWLVWITDDTTVPGHWARVQFAAGVSSAVAASLAGAGLRANTANRLDQNLPTLKQNGNYTLTTADRARILENTGGSVTHTFTTVSPSDQTQLADGWFIYEKNTGTGNITLQPTGCLIDGQATKLLAPGESCIVISDGTNLQTIGYGRAITSTVTGASINTAAGGTINLATPQIQAQIQDWTGTPPSATTLDYGGAVGYWFVWNHTAGTYPVTARCNSADAGVIVPAGNYSILRSNGTNMQVAFTATTGTVTKITTVDGELSGGHDPPGITSTGTIGLADVVSLVPGTYGAAGSPGAATTAAKVPIIQLDQKGRAKGNDPALGTNQYTLGTSANFNAGAGANAIPVLAQSWLAQAWALPNDTAIPGALPTLNGGAQTGMIIDYALAWAPPGWILATGTIGNAASAATNRRNQDCRDLFMGIYLSYSDAMAPVSGGRTGTTVATALADFNAGKTIAVIDFRGFGRAGLDNMLGAAAGRITNFTVYPDGNTLGAYGGTQYQVTSVGFTSSGAIVNDGANRTSGALSVHVAMGTDGGNQNQYGGIVGSGDTAHGYHTHNVDGWFNTQGAMAIFANVSVYGSANTNGWVNSGPIRMVNVLIKL